MSLWKLLLDRRMSQTIRKGRLEIAYPDGSFRCYAGDARSGLAIRINSERWLRRIILDPELAFGEAYMEGGVEIDSGDIYDLLELIWANFLTPAGKRRSAPAFVRRSLRFLSQLNLPSRARQNASHHYDIGNEFYRLFLDEDLQYSCALHENPNATLEDAQLAKKNAISKKLLIEPNHSVLDIGCGWGGLALHLAGHDQARVEGITLSAQQLNAAKARAKKERLDGRVRFHLEDYRRITDQYDRIVSVGMIEHVGAPYFQEYFDQISRLLRQDGIALIHTIGRSHGPDATNPWIAKYIFPGGYIPALSEIMPAIERAGLYVLDIEVLRLHYAETLKEWRRRFHENAAAAERLFDSRFVRMWDFYLAGSELSFRYGDHAVFQIQLAKRQDAAPLTRRYLYEDADQTEVPVAACA